MYLNSTFQLTYIQNVSPFHLVIMEDSMAILHQGCKADCFTVLSIYHRQGTQTEGGSG